MPISKQASKVLWTSRIAAAQKYKRRWSNTYRCDLLEKYWRGFQWKGKKDFFSINYNPYTLNLFYSTIKGKCASNLFQKPEFVISPRAANDNVNMDFAVQSATIKQDVLNTIVQNPHIKFVKHLKRAYIDSFFRFGIIEVGYSNDWRNPQKDEPLLKSYLDPDVGEEKDRVLNENDVPINERFYIKRVKPSRFLVSVSDVEDLEDHDWCGYLEYYYTRMLQNTKGIKFDPADGVESTYGSDFSGYVGDTDKDNLNLPIEMRQLIDNNQVTPVWRIWSNIEKKQLLLRDGDFQELWSTEFHRLPLVDLRWDEELSGFYPIPPCYQWISPQDEINESREQVRSYRRRFTNKFQYVEGTVDQKEVEKFTSGPDGVLVKVKRENAISPIGNPDIGHTADEALVQAKDDFYTITGTDAQAPQNSDRETATAAKLLDAKSQVRESADQLDFTVFLCMVGREILAQAQEKMVSGMWIKYTADPSQGVMQDANTTPIFKWIKAQDIADGYDFDIEADVINDTPQARQAAQQSFISFLAIVQNYPAVAMSPVLIRQAAYVCGFRNEKVIQQYQQTAALSMAMKAAQAQAAQGQQPQLGGGNPNNAATTQTAQMATPTIQQTNDQLTNQLQ